jgi:hypothetical protein
MLDIMVFILLLAAAPSLTWLTQRTWRRCHGVRRWIAVGLTGLCALIVYCLAVVSFVGLLRMNGRDAPVPELQVAGTPEQIERGREIAESLCGGCHSRQAPLTGGFDVARRAAISSDVQPRRLDSCSSLKSQSHAHMRCFAGWSCA